MAVSLPEERAPVRPRRRLRYLVAGGLCVAAVAYLVFGLSENVVYFRTVSEAVAEQESIGEDRFRLMGEVVAGSQVRNPTGVAFEVTDGHQTARVVHEGDPPELFGDGIPVVCEGAFREDGSFASDRIMVRHGSEYRPPDVTQPES